MHAAALLYVCTVSDFTLPIYEACLNLRPQQLVLIVSQADKFRQAADRLQRLLNEKLPDCRITRLDDGKADDALHGDELVNDWQWLKRKLCPLLRQAQTAALQRVLNITGGTKAFALALQACHDWTRIDYVPHGKGLQSYRFAGSAEGEPGFVNVGNGLDGQAWQTIGALELARLYNDNITPWQENAIDRAGNKLGLAQQIWDGQLTEDEGLRQLLHSLDVIWSSSSAEYQRPLLTLRWEKFFALEQDWQTAFARCCPWLERLQALRPPDTAGAALLSWDKASIQLPGNKAKKAGKAWRDWVSGGWLEQVAHDWLLSDGLPPAAIARNIRAGDDNKTSSTMREADILVHHQHRSALIEIKAGLPPGSTPADFEKQLSSLGDRFGRSDKALLLGPLLQQQLQTASRLEDFELRCKANSVRLLYSKRELLDFIHGRKSPSTHGNTLAGEKT